jgi:hypothetical protein
MKHFTALLILLSAFSFIANAGNGLPKDSIKLANPRDAQGEIIWSGLGAGMGMDYGGFGINYTAFLVKNVGFFAGVGFAYAKVGYNLGLKLRFLPGSKLNPFALGMYGYNDAYTVSENSAWSAIFNGYTVGIGTDYRAKPKSKGYWSVALLLPFKTSEASDYEDTLNTQFKGNYDSWVNTVGFSIGYHWIIRGHRY